MNNHANICQNINMIIFLIFFISASLILLNKKVKFNIDFSVIGFEYNFCITINYFFDVITLYKEDILKYKSRFAKKIENNNIKENNRNINIKSNKGHHSFSKIKENINKYKWIMDFLNIERINLEAKIGILDVFFTSMIIPFISTISAILLQKYCKTSTKTFSINPVYNELFLSVKGATYITVKFKDVLYIAYKIWRQSNKKS